MTKKPLIHLVFWLIIGILYTQLSVFMANFYESGSRKGCSVSEEEFTVLESVLVKPVCEVIQFIPKSGETSKQNTPTKKQSFLITFFVWPVFLVIAIVHWGVMFILTALLLIGTLVGILLSYTLKLVIWLVTSYSIF